MTTAAPPRTTTVTLAVTGKELVADGVATLTLAHPDGGRLRDWTPGAHIDVVLPNGLTRQYSLCGDRWDARSYRVGVLRETAGRGGSAYVHEQLQPGDLVGVGGPRNNFPLVPSERYLFVAGGIGITPLLPMVRQAEQLGADWRLLYGGRRRGSMAFLDELAPYGGRVLVRPEDAPSPEDLAGFLGEPQPAVANGSPLSHRETEVLRLVAEGRTDKQISATLVLSEHTVHRHVANILVKLRLSSRAAAAAHAAKHGLTG